MEGPRAGAREVRSEMMPDQTDSGSLFPENILQR
jgi:hypothetical protein